MRALTKTCALWWLSLSSFADAGAFATEDQRQAQLDRDATTSIERSVQDFYDWYVPHARQDRRGPDWALAVRQRRSALSTELARALEADLRAQADEGASVGLDFDPFLDSEYPCDRYEAGPARQVGFGYHVEVFEVCYGTKRRTPAVIAELARHDGRWSLANFHYPGARRDLLRELRRLAKSREDAQRECGWRRSTSRDRYRRC